MSQRTILSAARTWAGILLLAAGPVCAAENEFTLNLKSLVLGDRSVDVDTNSAKYNEYQDIRDGFWVPQVEIEGKTPDRARWMTIELANVGQRDARYTLNYDVSGRYSFLLDYNRIPHHYQNGATLLWSEVRPGVFEIADPIQKAIQSSILAVPRSQVTFAFLNSLIEPYLADSARVDVGIQRDRTHARLDLEKSSTFSWVVDYRHENRTGSRPYGASFGFNNVTELPEPIDTQTDDATLGGQWHAKSGGLRFGYRYSKFDNNIDRLLWDNPFRATDSTDASAYQAPGSASVTGSARGQAALNPDNRSGGVYLNGDWRFSKTTWMNFSLNVFDYKQDAPLLPLTVNSSIRTPSGALATDPSLLPASRADTKVDVTNATGDFGTRFAESFTLRLRYRYYDYKDKSRAFELPGYVRFDGVWEDLPIANEPLSWTRDTLSGELGWELGKAGHLGLEYRRDSMNRQNRDVKTTDDDLLRLTFDSRFAPGWSVRAAAENGRRSNSGYEEDPGMPLGTRRFDEADRDYSRYNALVQWNPGEKLSFSLGTDTRKDDYTKSTFGLTLDKTTTPNFDFSYLATDELTFYLFAQRAKRDADLASRQSGATPSTTPLDNWFAAFDEKNDFFGAGCTFGTKLVKLDVSARYSKSSGTVDFTALPGGAPLSGRSAGTTGAIDIPNYENIKLWQLLAKLDFKVQKNVAIGVYGRYDKYTIDSFILQGLDDYLPGALLLAGNRGDYLGKVAGVYLKLSY